MSWDEAFARRYDDWSVQMTEDIAFYAELARETDGPLVELAVGNGRVAIPLAQATGRSVIGIDSSPAMLEQAYSRALEAGVDLDLREGDMRGHCCTYLPGLIDAGPSNVLRRRSVRAAGSPGTPSRSIIRSRPNSTGSTRTSRCPTQLSTRSVTTESTSRSTTAVPAPCGGQPKTNGSVSLMSRGSSSRLSSAASTDSRWTTTAANTCSSPGAEQTTAWAQLPELREQGKRRYGIEGGRCRCGFGLWSGWACLLAFHSLSESRWRGSSEQLAGRSQTCTKRRIGRPCPRPAHRDRTGNSSRAKRRRNPRASVC